MKTIFIFLINIFYLILIIQCSSSKKISDNTVTPDTIDQSETKVFESSNHIFRIYCGKDTAYYNIADNSLNPNNTRIYYCLNEKAFQGDTASIRQAKMLINNNPYSLGYFKKPRGQILFKAVLDRLHNFEFVSGPNGDMDFYTYYGSYASVMSEMIVSIDGMSQYDYLNKHIYTKERTELESEELFSPKYIQILARLSWETYKEAYDKGLIKLKAFGQE